MFNQGKPPVERNLILRQILYSLVFFSLLAVGCRSSSQAQVVAPSPTPTPVATAENQCTPPNLPLPNKTAAQIIWKGSGDFDLLWTTNNITANDNRINRTSFSLDKFAVGKTVEELGAAADWYCDYESYERSYKILSLVGNLLTLEETAASSPQTYVTVKYRTVNLSDENRKVSLTDYFPAKEVFAELIKNPIIKAGIAQRREQLSGTVKRKKAVVPNSLDEFFKLFECSAAEKQEAREFCGELDFSGDESSGVAEKFGASQFFIKSDLLDAFAFEGLKNGKVTIQILVPAVTGNRSEEGIPVKLQLNVPSSLKDSLAKANLRQDSFLMRDKNSFWKKDGDGEYLSANIILASNQ